MFAGNIFSCRLGSAHRNGPKIFYEDEFYEMKYFNSYIARQNIILNGQNIRPELLGVVIFGILVYKGDLFDRLETPLFKSLNMYEDNPVGNEAEKTKKEAFKQIWNTVQQDVMKL